MFEEIYSRPPEQAEVDSVETFLAEQAKLRGGDAKLAWSDLAHVLFNSKEFIFVR